jgi:uncharacterized protein
VRIAIQDAKPGMTVAEPIVLPDGTLLVEKSTPLTSEIIIRLTLTGITGITIANPETPSIPDSTAAVGKAVQRVQVFISEDAMSARIVIEPRCEQSEELTSDFLRRTLEENGVVYGIDEPKLLEFTQRWNAVKERFEFEGVAQGALPAAGKEGPCHIKVPHVSTTRELEVIHKARGYWEASKYLANLHRVIKCTVVAEKKFSIPPQPGINVRGEPVIGTEKSEDITILETGVRLSEDGKEFIAEEDGILYAIDEKVGIAPLDFNGSFELTTDKMTARLCLHLPGEGGVMPPETDLRSLIKDNRVDFGIKDEVIKELFTRIGKGEIPADPITIAEGLAPEHGKNGSIEFLFNTKTSLAPKVNPDGSVDYKNVDIIVAVPKGKELARLVPPTPGKNGKTIFGDEIACREGSPAALPTGPNTEADPNNADSLIASIDGIVRYTGGYVEVAEGYVIKGDVDFKTGNIKYDKSVIINGDLKAGFSVECGGDLQVSGLIEDCTVTVGGNVLCKHGFIGQGKGVIDAKGDVNIGFILNQTVKSRKSVNVAREAINSTIYARQSITIHGNPLSIAGGTLVARESITVHTVGNHSGVQTLLEVGLDFALLEDLKQNEALVLDINQKHRKLVDSIKKYQHILKLGKKLAPQEDILYNKVKIAIAKIEEQMSLLDKRKKIIEVKMHELSNAHIKVEHAGMPGTCFKIGDLRHFCKDEVIGPKTVRLIKGEISIA